MHYSHQGELLSSSGLVARPGPRRRFSASTEAAVDVAYAEVAEKAEAINKTARL